MTGAAARRQTSAVRDALRRATPHAVGTTTEPTAAVDVAGGVRSFEVTSVLVDGDTATVRADATTFLDTRLFYADGRTELVATEGPARYEQVLRRGADGRWLLADWDVGILG